MSTTTIASAPAAGYRRRRRPRLHVALAAEASPAYGVDGPGRHERLEDAVDEVVSVRLDELSEDELRTELGVLERCVRRLSARQGEAAGALASRQARRAAEAHPDDPRAGERARRQTAQDLAAGLGWDPGRATRTLKTDRELETLPVARQAARDGALTPEHARLLASVLRHLIGDERTAVETELVEKAAGLGPVEYGRVCRRRLAELAPEEAQADADRLHDRRAASVSPQPDGSTTLWATLSGLDAETVATGIDAFRTFDAPGTPPRSPAQRTADALVAMARAALDHGLTTTDHGSRPHVTVTIGWSELAPRPGWPTRPGPARSPPPTCAGCWPDSTITRVIDRTRQLPLDIGRQSRSTSVGVWKGTVARDRHCTYPGCDAPPSMCQAAHLDRRWRHGAGVSVAEVALACHAHHRLIDRLGLIGRIENGRVTWHPPD